MEASGADIPNLPGNPPVPTSSPVLDYKDRSTGLLVFGIIEIGGGVLAALAIPFAILGGVFSRRAVGAAVPLGSTLVSVTTYAVLAVVLITLGIGSTQAKRWACALNLILSWIWLIMGVLVTVLLIAVLPSSFMAAAEHNPGARPVPPGITAVVLTFFIVLATIFLVIVPTAFLLFYRSKNVQETCRRRDPVERWTDRRPLPVLAVALLAASGAAYSLAMSVTTPLFPLFGKYLTGAPGAAALLVFAAIDAYVAFAFFRLQVTGWWVAVFAMIFRLMSAAVTYARGNLLEAYLRMGLSGRQMEMMRANPMFRSGAFFWFSLVFIVLYLGFLLWVKRYFPAPDPPSYTGLNQFPKEAQPGS